MAWDDLTLYVDDDVLAYEPNLAAGLSLDKHDLVKEHLASELLLRFEHLQKDGEELYGDDYYLLDHIENPEILRRPAVFYCLYLLFYAEQIGGENDIYARKAKEYFERYKMALEYACRRIKFDSTVESFASRWGSVRLAW